MVTKIMASEERVRFQKVKECFAEGRTFVLLRFEMFEKSYDVIGISDPSGSEAVLLDAPLEIGEQFFSIACEHGLSSLHLKEAAEDYCCQWQEESDFFASK